MQFAWFRNAVVVCVLPQEERGIDSIIAIYPAVAVATIFRLVIFSEGEEAVAIAGGWLRCKVAEQLRAIINRAIAVAV